MRALENSSSSHLAGRLVLVSQALKFLAFGLVALALDATVFWTLLCFGFVPTWAKTAGYLFAVSFSLTFLMSRVFSEKNSASRVVLMALIYGATGIVNVATFRGALAVGMPEGAGFILATAGSAALNFILLRALLIFRRTDDDKSRNRR